MIGYKPDMIKNLILLALMLFVMAPSAFAHGEEFYNINPEQYNEPLSIISEETGEEHKFMVEIAAAPRTVMRGLMFRSAMGEDNGMLFLFPRKAERNFWMKNTYIPLDILFLNGDNTIHHIHENAVPLDTSQIPSNGPILNVLELNGGVASKLGIKAGDRIVVGDRQALIEKHLKEPDISPLERMRQQHKELAE